MQTPQQPELAQRLIQGSLHGLFSLFVIGSSIWLVLILWFQQPFGLLFSRILIGLWIAFAMSILGIYISRHLISRKLDVLIYLLVFLCSQLWYFGLPPRQDRDWNPEVAQLLHSERHGDQVILHNVRNFDWHSDGSYEQRWESRRYDLNQIRGVNIITSYWMGPQIAHTLVSFDFANAAPLTFSIEIRKERHEEFSSLGGFFRKYELSLVAADEKILSIPAVIFAANRSIFPAEDATGHAKALFLEYLAKADELAQQPKWYNTLTSNCTTLVFDMVQAVSNQTLPTDYRLLASGYLPNYLYDLQALDQSLSIESWYQRAYINPRVEQPGQLDSAQFSALIRQGLPAPSAPGAPSNQ